ncbi:glycosyltransferase [Sporosarcina sp. ZBG7A]|uniref:glycosyltransferase n=1 Tax=Sporosarcina sp. ZBG7A TaxID=1582223 RepID=UPI00057B45C4|nr:glycosyltransferase [Sporosarcina sp. ZBG7A]
MIKVMIYQGRPTSGGSKKSLFNLVKLLKDDLSFGIVVGSKGWFSDQLDYEDIEYTFNLEHISIQKNNGVKNYAIRKMKSTLFIFLFGFKTMMKNYKYIKKEKINVVLLNESRDFFFVGIPAFVSRCKIVSYVRGEPSYYDVPRFLFSTNIVSLSEKLITNFPMFLRRKTEVIPNFIKLEEDFYHNIKLQNKNINIAFIGSIIPIKGLENLVEIAKKIDCDNYVINIYGDIPSDDFIWYKSEIKNLIEMNNLDGKFVFNGWKNNVTPCIKQSDIVVLTSKSEGLPRVLLEAMALSKPVIGFDVGGVSSLIQDNVNGYLINYGENEIFSRKISKLIKNRDERVRFGKQGLNIVKNNFSEEIVKEKSLKVFSEPKK